jgi:hypothetical protein
MEIVIWLVGPTIAGVTPFTFNMPLQKPLEKGPELAGLTVPTFEVK